MLADILNRPQLSGTSAKQINFLVCIVYLRADSMEN